MLHTYNLDITNGDNRCIAGNRHITFIQSLTPKVIAEK